MLPDSFSRDPDRLRRFEQEARAVSALNHPNILTLHDVGESGGAPYVVAELLEGETLRQRLLAGPLGARKAIEYGVQVAHGLAAAHEKGIAHRDLKPENIFVTADGRVKILDFGLAKLATRKPKLRSRAPRRPPGTQPGVVMGSVGYMAPEQVRGRPADHRSDLFAFGAVLYEMLTGDRPFHGGSAVETLNSILKDDPPEPSRARSDVSPALDRVVRRCLEKNPAERFQSARDLGFALTEASGALIGAPARGWPRRRGRTAAVRRRRGSSLLLAALFAANVGGLRNRLRRAPRAGHPIARRAAAPESVARSGAGVFRRRDDRGADHRSRADPLAARHLAHLRHGVQGDDEAASPDRPRARRGRDSRRLGAARGQSRAHHRAAHRGGDRPACSGRRATSATSRRFSRSRARWPAPSPARSRPR